MIDNNIIQSLGAGSGIDTNNLVTQLTEIERAAPQERIDNRRELTETKISDFGILKSALATLQDAAEVLIDEDGLFSKSASFTESDALVPTELDANVATGTYAFTVEQIALSQSLAFAGFEDPTDAVGEGVLTFNFGAWARDGSNNIDTGASTPFTLNAESTSATITIDSSNNSLEGLRDAINNAEIGVTASIIFDGTDYHLTLLAESGEDNQLEITVAEAGGSPTNTDSSDLSRFAFNTGIADINAVETQLGQDAQLTFNGLTVNRATNSIDDIVDGLSLDVLKSSAGETISITVSDDKTFAEQNIRDFVTAYNLFLDAVEPAFNVTEVENEDGDTETVVGSLSNDSLGKSILTQIRTVIATAIPGLGDSDLTSLTNIGIRTELDGTLSISEDEFTEAFDQRFEDIQKLFAPHTVSSSSDISINSFNDSTTAGQYEVAITTNPSKGFYNADAINAAVVFPDFDATGKTYTFKINVDGNESATLTIPESTYASQSDLAAQIQTLINSDSTVADGGSRVTVSYDSVNDRFDITSNRYGSSSTIQITEASTDLEADLGLLVTPTITPTDGTTVAGTIDGVAGFGSANVLLPALTEPGTGLALVVGENATSATVNFSRGFAGELTALIDTFLASDGIIATREETLEDSLESLDTDQERLDRRITAFEERLIQQFIAMERILSSLNTSGGFLENLINTLPFTASGDN